MYVPRNASEGLAPRRQRIVLILNRRRGEEIVIADEIRVTVVAIKGNHVRLGITAPSSVPVMRQELLVDSAKAEESSSTDSNGTSKGSLHID
jgi:carbon storage regulator